MPTIFRSLFWIYYPIYREEETPNRGDIGSSYTTAAPWNDPRRPQRPEVTPRTPLLPQVWILCFKCFLNPIRFYLMRESDSKMTKPKAGQNPLSIHLHLIFERDFWSWFSSLIFELAFLSTVNSRAETRVNIQEIKWLHVTKWDILVIEFKFN